MEKIELRDLVGGAWKLDAKNNIHEYLMHELEGDSSLVVIS